MGLDREIGSMKSGKLADVIAIDLGSFELCPVTIRSRTWSTPSGAIR